MGGLWTLVKTGRNKWSRRQSRIWENDRIQKPSFRIKTWPWKGRRFKVEWIRRDRVSWSLFQLKWSWMTSQIRFQNRSGWILVLNWA